MHKRCAGCKVTKPWADFYAKTKWPDGTMRQPHSHCRECFAIRNAEYIARRRVEDPAWYRARRRRELASVNGDPERAATRRTYKTEWQRRARGAQPAAQPAVSVDAAPVLAAVEASGVVVSEIARRAELNRSTAAKALRRERMSSRHARAILEAIGLSPLDVGL